MCPQFYASEDIGFASSASGSVDDGCLELSLHLSFIVPGNQRSLVLASLTLYFKLATMLSKDYIL